jgi:hypothetical protein
MAEGESMPKRKSCIVDFKGSAAGTFKATLATFNVVDKDGDVTFPGAFPEGKAVVISAYMHTSWMGALPVGKGVIRQDDKTAWVDGEFFTNTTHGKDTYLTVKALAESGQGEWSYGYDVLGSSNDVADLEPYPGGKQILKSLDVFEASPVLIGAGVGTATQSIKSARKFVAKIKTASADPDTMAAIAQIDNLADQLDEAVDSLMDQLGIEDPDEANEPEEGADAELTDDNLPFAPPKGRPSLDPATLMGSISAYVARAKQRASLRSKEGRVLSSANRERLASLLGAMGAAATEVQALLDETDPGKSAPEDAEIYSIWLAEQKRIALAV